MTNVMARWSISINVAGIHAPKRCDRNRKTPKDGEKQPQSDRARAGDLVFIVTRANGKIFAPRAPTISNPNPLVPLPRSNFRFERTAEIAKGSGDGWSGAASYRGGNYHGNFILRELFVE